METMVGQAHFREKRAAEPSAGNLSAAADRAPGRTGTTPDEVRRAPTGRGRQPQAGEHEELEL
jgi:hypothetical protein